MLKKEIFPEPDWRESEIWRYARCKEPDEELKALLKECISEAKTLLKYEICYDLFPVSFEDETQRFSTIEVRSSTLKKAFSGCESLLLFCATVGAGLDRLILRYSRTAPTKALLFQAIGAERVESLCDAFCEKMSERVSRDGLHLRTRVSPGYGDIPLSMQKDILSLLDLSRKLGITLSEDLLMHPTKTVTALAGIGCQTAPDPSGCNSCEKTDCLYRKKD